MTNQNDPAFASPKRDGFESVVNTFGLTKREYFTAQALRGAIEWRDKHSKPENFNVGLLAKDCVMIADALIKELSK